MRRLQTGFSLIELMIVIAIISILAAIALPVYFRQQARAAENACLAEMKSYVSLSLAATVGGDDAQTAPAQACTAADSFVSAGVTVTGTPKSPGTRRAVCRKTDANCALEP